MKSKLIAGLALACLAFTACDDSTDTIGSSLSENIDGLTIQTATFDVESRSILPDSVLSRSATGYLGKVRDLETRGYITGDFMTQFNILENYKFPDKDSIVSLDANKQIIADSCELHLFYTEYYGDSTQTMKLTAYEMSRTMNEDRLYYSNFDPLTEGYVRSGGIEKDKTYSLVDYNVAQNVRDTSTYMPYITIKLNEPYTDTDGKTYNNYGSYIINKYYDHPEYFKNAYSFRNNVVPGFFFKWKSGLGSMAYITDSQLNVYYRATVSDTTANLASVFWGTEEVLQTTTISNDAITLQQLANDQSCTYLKTPAGIFTELTLPVETIMNGHENDTITSARIVIQRINNTTSSEYAFDVPQNVLMIPRDSLYSFFENNELYDNKKSYVASWAYSSTGTTENSYTFNNISGMISAMYKGDKTSANWNKVVLVPVELTKSTTSSSYYSSTTTVTKVTNDMSLTTTKLVKGTSSNSPIQISVIYSKFK